MIKEDDRLQVTPSAKFNQCKVTISRVEKEPLQETREEIKYEEIEIYLIEKNEEEESKEKSVSMPCKLVFNQDTISISVPYPFKRDSQIVAKSLSDANINSLSPVKSPKSS